MMPEDLLNISEEFMKKEKKLSHTAEKIDNRRSEVYSLHMQGYSNSEIAEKVGVSLSTIEKDLNQIRKFSLRWFKQLSQSGFMESVTNAYCQLELVQKKLWEKLRKTEDDNMQLKILDQITNTSMKKLGIFASHPPYLSSIQQWELDDEVSSYEQNLKEESKENADRSKG
jgi:transposase